MKDDPHPRFLDEFPKSQLQAQLQDPPRVPVLPVVIGTGVLAVAVVCTVAVILTRPDEDVASTPTSTATRHHTATVTHTATETTAGTRDRSTEPAEPPSRAAQQEPELPATTAPPRSTPPANPPPSSGPPPSSSRPPSSPPSSSRPPSPTATGEAIECLVQIGELVRVACGD